MMQPLEGIRVLDLGRLLPGPFATQILADFGADVIKIEDPRSGDGFRTAAPQINGVSARHVTLNRNKRCLALNLKAPAGRKIFLGLARNAHVILEQFRPGVMARLGLDYDVVRAVNPRIVYCSLSGFGQSAPYRDLAAHDPNYLALAGVLSLIGRQGGAPALSGLQIADINGALLAALGILIAVRRAERDGLGDYLDLALFDGVLGTAITAAATYFGTGAAPRRGEERHTGKYPMADIYETADGGHVTIAAIEPPFWANLCRALGHEEWIVHHYAEGEKAEEIRAAMRAIFRTKTRDEWFGLLKDRDVCIGPVLGLEEALTGEQTAARGLVIPHEHPVAGPVSLLATPITLRNGAARIRFPAGRLGEDTDAILAELGYDAAARAGLRAEGVTAGPDDGGEARCND
jgi:crotonobetainyl-CoA:carnitine CoA-transferase CaiB-like acyl-CoA transferase